MKAGKKQAALRAATGEATMYLRGFGFTEHDLEPIGPKARRALHAAIEVEMKSVCMGPPSRMRCDIVESLRDAINCAAAKSPREHASTRLIGECMEIPYNAGSALTQAISGIKENLSAA